MISQDKILATILKWAKKEKKIKVALLSGSRARNKNVDEFSDYDIALFCSSIPSFIHDNEWLSQIGKYWVCVPEKVPYKRKIFPSRLVIFNKGIKVDFIFYSIDVLKDMIKTKNLSEDLRRGYEVLLDKEGIAKKIPKPSLEIPIQKPTQKQFMQLCEEFWFEAYHVAKYLKREDLWMVKSRDWGLKNVFLLKMIEWHESAKHNWNYATNSIGKNIKSWTNTHTYQSLHKIFAHFDGKDSWSAFLETMDLFRKLAKETAKLSEFSYPEEVDENFSRYILNLR